MAIDQTKKSNRLLGSRRFTSDALNTSQEAFQSVLDIRANEIFTEANLIPTSSLPFSGSSQQRSSFSTQGSSVLKYYFRHRLTRSNVANDVFFFLVPTGSVGGVTPQLIQDGQETSFVSPKYSLSSLANANTEDSTPGYNVKVFKSTSTDSGSLGSGDVVLNTISSSLIPKTDDKHDIGATTKEWKDLFIDGTANIDTLSLTDGFTYNGVTFNTSGSASPATNLSVTASNFDFKSTNSSDLVRFFNGSGETTFKLDDKVVVFGAKTGAAPTPVAGGLYYSGSDHFFLGFEGSGLP